ncbi:MAG: outer membrane protein assembly factor BamA [Deltaproteobacteria bacterium]|nr:outer membrane protein assembly factor BamA [Deltaproteobacteria bacterium]
MRQILRFLLLLSVALTPAISHVRAQDGDDAEDADDGIPEFLRRVEEPYEPATQPTAPALRTLCHGRMIRRIDVEGTHRVEADDVRATLRLRRGLPCTDAEVARDARALWDEGFFDDIVVEAEAVDHEVILTIRVTERPAIASIVFEGNDEISEDDIQEKVTLEEGGVLSMRDVRRNVTKIRDLYAEKGYFLARVNYELVRLPGDRNEVEVRFHIEEGSEVAVRRIRFAGNHAIDDDELRGIMQTSESGFFSFLSSDDAFDKDKFEEDTVRLQAYYYDKGYLQMQVGTPRIELTPDRSYIDLTVPITEGPRYRIGELSIAEVDTSGEEVDPLIGRAALQSGIDAQRNDWFSRSRIARSLMEVTREYRDRGYARVEVTPETNLHADDHVVDIVVSIHRGPLVTIERITIHGNSKTRDSVIRREIRIMEGDLYSQSLVEESKGRITALGYFESVDVSEEDGSADDQIVLNFEVTERATGTFQVGAGFSSIESFILTAQIQQQNLFGNGQSLALQLQLSGIRQLITLRFTEPYFLGTEWSSSVDVFKTIRQYQSFNRDSTGGGLTFGHPIFDERLRLAAGYRAEFIKVSALTGGAFTGSGSGRQLVPDLPLANLRQSGLTSSLRLSLTWDSRDNRLFPTSGIYASYSLEVAERFLGSENIFVRQSAFARFYHRIWGPFVFKVNTQLGLITTRDGQGVPISERYFLGGIYNVRGYGLYSLGPRPSLSSSADPNQGVPTNGFAIGGNFEAYYQAELEFTILESVGIRGVVFTDGGNLWNLESNFCQSGRPSGVDRGGDPCGFRPSIYASWGFGLRWFSPLGPLRFEWGVPFVRRSFDRKIRFEFTIGNSF